MGTNSIINPNRGDQIHEPTPDSPYHKRRREDMRTRIKQYGFYPVATEPAPPVLCTNCAIDLSGSTDWIKINGDPICGNCLNNART
jgi:hypothetical protein